MIAVCVYAGDSRDTVLPNRSKKQWKLNKKTNKFKVGKLQQASNKTLTLILNKSNISLKVNSWGTKIWFLKNCLDPLQTQRTDLYIDSYREWEFHKWPMRQWSAMTSLSTENDIVSVLLLQTTSTCVYVCVERGKERQTEREGGGREGERESK